MNIIIVMLCMLYNFYIIIKKKNPRNRETSE